MSPGILETFIICKKIKYLLVAVLLGIRENENGNSANNVTYVAAA